MGRYLHAWGDDAEYFHVAVSDAGEFAVAQPRGRSSQLLRLDPHGNEASLGPSGAILFLVPRRPAEMLATLTNDLEAPLVGNIFLSHGHACAVLLLSTDADAERIVTFISDQCVGWEIWPHTDGRVEHRRVSFKCPATSEANGVSPISTVDHGFEAAAQIRQFNANLTLLSRVVNTYAPEILPLVQWLRESVGDIASTLPQTSDQVDEDDATRIRRAIGLEATLVETNAVITLYTSQLGSGSLPLSLGSSFPVGEYSLLGIGAMCRAAWRIYAHLNETFGRFDHVGVVQRIYSLAPGFDVFQPSSRSDFSGWQALRATQNIAALSDHSPEGFRYHVPYFSSRWGFHESFHSISLSWQCLYASASKEWNLLTVTHEFLHAHIRDLLNEILQPDEPDWAAKLCARYNRHETGNTMRESTQTALVEALVGIRGGTRLARQIAGSSSSRLEADVPDELDPEMLRSLMRAHSGYIHELMVHVLDYYYVYAGRDDEFINSVWSSWSLVPTVMDHVEHYVLRTLCTLGSNSNFAATMDMFPDVVERLKRGLVSIRNRARTRPVVAQALDILNDQTSLKRLCIEFMAARYVVEFTRVFLLDGELNAELVRDDLTVVTNDQRAYDVAAGTFTGDIIQSPIGFLLDRFPGYSDQAGTLEAECESIWQMLSLT